MFGIQSCFIISAVRILLSLALVKLLRKMMPYASKKGASSLLLYRRLSNTLGCFVHSACSCLSWNLLIKQTFTSSVLRNEHMDVILNLVKVLGVDEVWEARWPHG